MKKFTANTVENNNFTENQIQCIATKENRYGSIVWLDPNTNKKYIIAKMYRKSWFIEIKE